MSDSHNIHARYQQLEEHKNQELKRFNDFPFRTVGAPIPGNVHVSGNV